MKRFLILSFCLTLPLLANVPGFSPAELALLRPAETTASPLLTDLVAFWKMDESGSVSRVDSINSVTLAVTGTVDSTNGVSGNAAGFVNTSANQLTVGDNTTLSMGVGVDWTISARVWLNVTNQTAQTVLSKMTAENAAGMEYMMVYTTAAGFNSFYMAVSDGTTYNENYSQVKFQTNTWAHVVIWCDASEGDVFIRVNDTTTTSLTTATYAQNGTATFRIGAKATGDPINGNVDDVGVWKRILTAGEITELAGGWRP